MKLGKSHSSDTMARSLLLQMPTKSQKTLKRESALNGLRKAIAVVATNALGRPLTPKLTEEAGTNPEAEAHLALRLEGQLLAETVVEADRTLLEKVTKTVKSPPRPESNLSEARLHQAKKVQSFATLFAKANARTETSVTFGTHHSAEMNPLLRDVSLAIGVCFCTKATSERMLHQALKVVLAGNLLGDPLVRDPQVLTRTKRRIKRRRRRKQQAKRCQDVIAIALFFSFL